LSFRFSISSAAFKVGRFCLLTGLRTKLSAAVSLSLSLSLSTSIAVSSGEDARLAGVVFVEELGERIFLRFGVVVARVGCSSSDVNVLSILERFF
jgi:hypothetical protein